MHRHADPTHMSLMSNDKVGGSLVWLPLRNAFKFGWIHIKTCHFATFVFVLVRTVRVEEIRDLVRVANEKKGLYFRDNAWSQPSAAQGWFLYPFVLVYLISLQGLSNHHSSSNDAESLVTVGLHTRLWKLFVSYQWDKTLLGIFRELCLECCRIRKKNLKFSKFISIFHLHILLPPFFLNTKVYLIEGSRHPLSRGLQNVSRCT